MIRVVNPGFGSWIRTLTFYLSRIPDPGVKKSLDPGSGSWFFTHPGSRIPGSKRRRIPDHGSGSLTTLLLKVLHSQKGGTKVKWLATTLSGPDPNRRILLNPDPDPGCCWIRVQSGSRPRFLITRKNLESKTVIYVFKKHTVQASGESPAQEKTLQKKISSFSPVFRDSFGLL